MEFPKRTIAAVLFAVLPFALIAQKKLTQPPYTSSVDRTKGYEQRKKLEEKSLVSDISFRSVGPTVMSGRVVDIEVDPKQPEHFYVAYASGSLWETTNNGISFTPLFDDEMVMTIGDIVIDPHTNDVWIGSGENNSSRSSYAGSGIYKGTKDAKGKMTFTNLGLGETHHIGRMIFHPTKRGTMWVAALGHLYSPNDERGVYKTTDGGASWKKVLFVDDNSGAVDLVIDPSNPDVLYTAIWERERRAWNFKGNGKGSGIYKSTDGGENWNKIATKGAEFPQGDGVGRIGLSVCPTDPNVVYAVLDNQFRTEKKAEEKGDDLTKDDLRNMSKETFLGLSEDKLTTFLENNDFPDEYDAASVIRMVKRDKITPLALVEYLEDANSLLFDTPVKGCEVYKSLDAGKTWSKMNEDKLDGVFYSYGYYFGQIRVSPSNCDHIYIFGVPILKSEDGGKTYKSLSAENVHADHHALWIDPENPKHLVNGNDGGVNISYDDGATWLKSNTPSVGQFYSVNVDMAKPYNVYGGLQDNGVWTGSKTYQASRRWHQSGRYPYKSIMGGDGMQVEIDHRDNNTVYTGFQFGNYFRVDKTTGDSEYITPHHELGQRPLRFNWQAPIHLSVHNRDILYMGSHRFHRSMNRGDEFKTMSKDLTKGGRKGNVAYGTLTSIHESPLKFGLIYVGSDDGLIHVTRDGGNSWKKISTSLEQDMWVSRVQASAHETSRVYASLNGYRWDDFKAYLYVSEDYGNTWKSIGGDLPAEPINVVKEDPENANILYVGTDHGLYVSVDRGATFMQMKKNLPATPVHDLVIHSRDNDLVVGTHGRSIYIADVEHLQMLTDEVLKKPLHAFEMERTRHNPRWGSSWSAWSEPFIPSKHFPIYLGADATSAKVTITTADGGLVNELKVEVRKGINYIPYDLSIKSDYVKALNKARGKAKKEELKAADNDSYYLPRGKYKAVIKTGAEQVEVKFTVGD
jgi:photosystem II stability/assembly factor-like uncharacterized protein